MSDDIADKRKRIDGMGLPEIIDFMRKIDGNEIWFYYGGALSKRLYEISMYDNYVSDSERKSASDLLEIIKGTMEFVQKELNTYVKGGGVLVVR